MRHFHIQALSGSSSGLGWYPGLRAAETIGGAGSSTRACTKVSNSRSCSIRYFRYRTASSGPRWIPSSLATATTSSTSGTAYIASLLAPEGDKSCTTQQSNGLRIGVSVRQRHPRLDEQRHDKAVVVCNPPPVLVWRIIDPFS